MRCDHENASKEVLLNRTVNSRALKVGRSEHASQSLASKPMFAELLIDRFADIARAICRGAFVAERSQNRSLAPTNLRRSFDENLATLVTV